MKHTTLQQFENENWPTEGHYAAWISAFIPYNGSFAHGFSGAIVTYTNDEGWSNYPEWFENSPSDTINLSLLEVIPSVHDLTH